MIRSKFKFGKDEVPMFMGFRLANTKMVDLGLPILDIIKDQSVISTIMVDDATLLKVWYFYLQEWGYDGTFEEALDILDEGTQGLEPFRKAFWDMVVEFSPTPLQPALNEMWREGQRQLKNVVEKTSSTSTSASQPD